MLDTSNFVEFFFKDFYKQENRQYLTDKGDTHNYIKGYYGYEFNDIREKPINILEIGLAHCGSAKLWRDWFVNGNIYVIEHDINLITKLDRINIKLADAYLHDTIDYYQDIEFDYIIDDGPHTLKSQIFSVKNWSNKLKPGGKLIIEDVQDINNIEVLKAYTDFPNRVIDLRETSFKRYDDIIFEITKPM